MHGYDVVDPSTLNPEIGSMEDFREFVFHLRKKNMGLILDIVPNHMAISTENPWWMDLLKNGPESKYAPYFDIDWKFGEGQIVLPALEEPFEEAVKYLKEEPGIIRYKKTFFPTNGKKKQYYRLCYWKEAKVNYRRFFDLNDYICMKVDNSEVFGAMHKTVFEWISEGLVDGLRVDHIDGLWDPYQYLKNLSQKCPYIVVEKILTGNERLRPEWPVQGTVGYDFLNQLNGLFIDQKNQEKILGIYQAFTGNKELSKDIKYDCKKLVLNTSFLSDVQQLARFIDKDVLVEVIACFPVYRSYIREGKIHEEDEKYIHAAIEKAKRLNPSIDFSVFGGTLEFMMQFQQLTGPVMAKGLEDTMFYRFYPLASLNEVGGEPGAFGMTVENFHKKNCEREKNLGFLSSTTHDTKRSEDVRARINVLSEIPEKWSQALEEWRQLNSKYKQQGPDSNEEYLLYQTLVGTWPNKIDEEYIQRIQHYMEKSLKEEKIHTSWTEVNVSYQSAVRRFIASILHSDKFVKSLVEFFETIKEPSQLNSLALVILKITSPGVVDIYQGNEAFTFNLVDPDNRQAVDFSKRDIKTEVVQKILNLRKELHPLFNEGSYIPIEIEGPLSNHVIAFAREGEREKVIVVTARFFTSYDSKKEAKTFLNMPFAGQFQDILSQNRVEIKSKVCLKEIFREQPFAVLRCC